MEGYRLKDEDEWQRTRMIYAMIYNVNVEHHHQMKPNELIPLPGDKKEAEEEQRLKTAGLDYKIQVLERLTGKKHTV